MKKILFILTLCFASNLATAQEVSTKIFYSQKDSTIVETTTLTAKMSDNVVKCYEEKDGWYVIIETTRVITKEQIEKALQKDKKDAEAIENRRKMLSVLKVKN